MDLEPASEDENAPLQPGEQRAQVPGHALEIASSMKAELMQLPANLLELEDPYPILQNPKHERNSKTNPPPPRRSP